MTEYQKTVVEQRAVIEKKQHIITLLERRVNDLVGDIQSLLHVKGKPEVQLKENVAQKKLFFDKRLSTYDISALLHERIQQVESFTPLGHLRGKAAPILDISLDSSHVDIRRLSACLDDDKDTILFIYSKMDPKFLFVNRTIKTMLGWGVDKFLKEFPELVVTGYAEWRQAVAKTYSGKESETFLVLRNKSNKYLTFSCLMSLIVKGPFANHIMGVLSIVDS